MSNPSSKAKNQPNIKRRKVQKSEKVTKKSNDEQGNLIFGLHAIQAALEQPGYTCHRGLGS